jgi:hypothetical protein
MDRSIIVSSNGHGLHYDRVLQYVLIQGVRMRMRLRNVEEMEAAEAGGVAAYGAVQWF